MKTFIILALCLLLIVGAFLSRPSKASFDQTAIASATAGDGLVKGYVDKFAAEQSLKSLEFKDDYLWTAMQRNGQNAYIGVFGHWFALSGGGK